MNIYILWEYIIYIDIPEEQLKILSNVCKKYRISRAEAIRRAISLYTNQNRSDYSEKAFGIWKKKKVAALNYQNTLKNEW